MHKKNIFISTLILTMAGIITRFLGFFYRIYMSNTIGAEGMGLYQLINPIYFLAWTIACSGFTTTVSKLTAEEKAKKEHGNTGMVVKISLVLTSLLGILLTLFVYNFADVIAINFIKDERVIIPLKILSLCFPVMSVGSIIRGYFFGLQESFVPAISQVLEQVIRMAVVFVLTPLAMPMGLTYAASAAVVGVVIGEFVSALYVIISYRLYKRKNSFVKKPNYTTMHATSIILAMAIPITLNRVSGSFLGTVENTLLPQKLQAFGLTSTEAISLFGQMTGMAVPLIYFPTALLNSLSTSLLPAVSEAVAVNKISSIKGVLNKSLMLASILGIGFSALFMIFPKEIGFFIYNQDISYFLFTLGFMCPLIYIQVVLGGILNGLGEQIFIFKKSILSSIISISFIHFLVPELGINAYILSLFVVLLSTNVTYLYKLTSLTGLKIEYKKMFLYPIISALACGLSLNLLAKRFIFNIFGNSLGLIIAIALMFLLYLFFVIALGSISLESILNLVGIKNKNHEKLFK